MWDSLNRRRFPRVSLKCEIEILDKEKPLRYSAMTENVGAGGVCLLLDKELPRFAMVDLRLDLGDGKDPLVCVGKVCWTVESCGLKTGKKFDTGIEFLGANDAERSRLLRLIDASAEKDHV